MSTVKAPQTRADWHDAYDAQMALWRWYRTREAARWVGSAIATAAKDHDAQTTELIYRLWDGEMGRLLDCDPVYVSQEMCDVVDAARESFQPEPLLETDLITPRGFLWFGRAIPMPDRYGEPLAIRAASWAREYGTTNEETVKEVEARVFSDEAWDERGARVTVEEFDAMIEEGIIFPAGVNVTLYAEREHYLYVTQHRNGMEAPDWAVKATEGLPVVPFHAAPWHFGMSFEGNHVDSQGIPSGMDQWWKLLQSTFRLMQQRIAARHFGRPHRSHRRTAKKLGISEPEVVVIRLRREAGERHEPSGEHAHYSHRFIVGAHWRNQPYRKEGITRQIWISPYVKGPEDKPLIVRPRRVYQWER